MKIFVLLGDPIQLKTFSSFPLVEYSVLGNLIFQNAPFGEEFVKTSASVLELIDFKELGKARKGKKIKTSKVKISFALGLYQLLLGNLFRVG